MQSIEWMVRFYLLETNALSLCWQSVLSLLTIQFIVGNVFHCC